MAKKEKNENIRNDGTYVVKKSRKTSVIALIVCFLVALLIWCYAKADAIKNVEIEESGGPKQTEGTDKS